MRRNTKETKVTKRDKLSHLSWICKSRKVSQDSKYKEHRQKKQNCVNKTFVEIKKIEFLHFNKTYLSVLKGSDKNIIIKKTEETKAMNDDSCVVKTRNVCLIKKQTCLIHLRF